MSSNLSQQISLRLMNQKGFSVLKALLETCGPNAIHSVISARDNNVQKDFYQEIKSLCETSRVSFFDREDSFENHTGYTFAIGWRWMIRDCPQLIVFHDSHLPRYRGFAPLITYLTNQEPEIGVTALWGADDFDTGDILAQRSISIQHPIKIADAINRICPLYADLAVELSQSIIHGKQLVGKPQDERQATYSVWRDDEDYSIDWSQKSTDIQRFIYAVGSPYLGASALLANRRVRILDANPIEDIKIENRTPGKVIFLKEGNPIVICGHGLIMITSLIDDTTRTNLLPFKNLRSRFQ